MKLNQKQRQQQACYSKLGNLQGIGIKTYTVDDKIPDGANLSLKLKPPKFPKAWDKSKKTYKNLFIRALKNNTEYHIYHKVGLYVVSLYKNEKEAYEWLNKNMDEIEKRIKQYE